MTIQIQLLGLKKSIISEFVMKFDQKYFWNFMKQNGENQFFGKIHLLIIDFNTEELKLDW